jgi:hypothetical protein
MPQFTGTQITPSTPTVGYTPTTIKPNATDTVLLVESYLFPLFSGLGISIPSGAQPVGFSFNLFPNGSSQAVVRWVPVPTGA